MKSKEVHSKLMHFFSDMSVVTDKIKANTQYLTPIHVSLSVQRLVLSSNDFHGLLVIHRNNAY